MDMVIVIGVDMTVEDIMTREIKVTEIRTVATTIVAMDHEVNDGTRRIHATDHIRDILQ